MAAPRKNTEPVNTSSGDSTPMTDEEKVHVAAAEQQPEQTPHPEPTNDESDQVAAAVADARAALTASTTEDIVLLKEAGGHKAGDTITVTHGAADYLREQGYVETEDDED